MINKNLGMTKKDITQMLPSDKLDYSIFNNDFLSDKDFKERKKSENDVKSKRMKDDKKSTKIKDKSKKRHSIKEDILQKYKNVRLTSPTAKK